MCWDVFLFILFLDVFGMFLGCLWKEMLRTGHSRHEFAHGVGNHAWICRVASNSLVGDFMML